MHESVPFNAADAYQQAQRAPLASLQIIYADGTPATHDELAQLQQCFTHLPAAYLQWLSQPQRHCLRVLDGEDEEAYILSSVPTALNNYADLQTWYDVGEFRDADSVTELMEYVRTAGFNPKQLLPIVQGVSSADYLVIRTDGVDTGKVFLWCHEELAYLSDLDVQVSDLLPWLAAQAKAGRTLVI